MNKQDYEYAVDIEFHRKVKIPAEAQDHLNAKARDGWRLHSLGLGFAIFERRVQSPVQALTESTP